MQRDAVFERKEKACRRGMRATFAPRVDSHAANKAVVLLDSIPAKAFVPKKLLMQLVPFSSATLWRKVASGDFPKPVKLSDRVTGWRVEDVRDWFEKKGLQ